MKIDFSQNITDHAGKDLPNGVEKGGDGKDRVVPLTLGAVSMSALNTPNPGPEPMNFDEAVRRGNLAIRVGAGGTHDVTPEEVTLIRSSLTRCWAPLVVARAAAMLDG